MSTILKKNQDFQTFFRTVDTLVKESARGRCCTLFFCQETIRDHLFDNLWKTCGNKKEEKLFGNQERRKEWLQVQLVKNDS